MENLIVKVVQKISEVKNKAQSEFSKNRERYGIGFCSIDELLPYEIAEKIYAGFVPTNPAWRLMDTFRERKLTSKKFDQFDPILKEITFALQDQRVISLIEGITGIENQLPDPMLYAGGLSLMRQDDFLDPHIDNPHDQFQKEYRRLNLLYYVTPDWKLENGGNLELCPLGQKGFASYNHYQRLQSTGIDGNT